MLMSNGPMLIQLQLVVMDSKPWSRKMNRGIRLMKNEIFTEDLACEEAQLGLSSLGERVVMSG